jgi:hypothetical protein
MLTRYGVGYDYIRAEGQYLKLDVRSQLKYNHFH